jgi:hypothetical protein
LPPDTRKFFLEQIPYLQSPYAYIEDDRIVFDNNHVKLDIVNFKIRNHIYTSNVTVNAELERNGFEVGESASSIIPALASSPKAKVPFKETFDLYCQLKAQRQKYSLSKPDLRIEVIEKTRPLVKEAYSKLGQAEVVRLNYNQTNIKRELEKKRELSDEMKAFEMCEQTFAKCTAIPVADVKRKLQKIYDTLGVKGKATATHLNA